MEAIKKELLPEEVVQWFDEVTAGRRQSSFKVYGYNSRFIVVRQIFESMKFDRNVLWFVFDWQERRSINIFLFKKSGGLTKNDKAKIKKDFSIDLTKVRSKLSL